MNCCPLTGIFAPVPTPFGTDGEVAYDHFARNLERWGTTSLDGIVVLGSNGEAAALRESEKIAVIAAARRYFPRHKKVIAGVGGESLENTLVLCREAAASGVDAALVVNPAYYRSEVGKPEALLEYYRRVADESPLPVLIYNVPRNTGINIPAGVVCQASRHENIIGVKDSGGDIVQISEEIRNSAPGFGVFAGSAGFLLPALYMGASGGVMATANAAPELCADIYKAFQAGEHSRARKMQMDILELNAALTATYGVMGLKFALDCLGYYGGPCRCPLPAEASEQARTTIKALLSRMGLGA